MCMGRKFGADVADVAGVANVAGVATGSSALLCAEWRSVLCILACRPHGHLAYETCF